MDKTDGGIGSGFLLNTKQKANQMATIRRNADGQQNLNDLRRELAASEHVAHIQGNNWIAQKWSEIHGAYIETPMPPQFDERMTIQWILFGAREYADEVIYHADMAKRLERRKAELIR